MLHSYVFKVQEPLLSSVNETTVRFNKTKQSSVSTIETMWQVVCSCLFCAFAISLVDAPSGNFLLLAGGRPHRPVPNMAECHKYRIAAKGSHQRVAANYLAAQAGGNPSVENHQHSEKTCLPKKRTLSVCLADAHPHPGKDQSSWGYCSMSIDTTRLLNRRKHLFTLKLAILSSRSKPHTKAGTANRWEVASASPHKRTGLEGFAVKPSRKSRVHLSVLCSNYTLFGETLQGKPFPESLSMLLSDQAENKGGLVQFFSQTMVLKNLPETSPVLWNMANAFRTDPSHPQDWSYHLWPHWQP